MEGDVLPGPDQRQQGSPTTKTIKYMKSYQELSGKFFEAFLCAKESTRPWKWRHEGRVVDWEKGAGLLCMDTGH